MSIRTQGSLGLKDDLAASTAYAQANLLVRDRPRLGSGVSISPLSEHQHVVTFDSPFALCWPSIVNNCQGYAMKEN